MLFTECYDILKLKYCKVEVHDIISYLFGLCNLRILWLMKELGENETTYSSSSSSGVVDSAFEPVPIQN
jgi:hypothetical protein